MGKALPVHLPGRLRELVGLVDEEGSVVPQQGPQAILPVSGVGKQIVVIADLDEYSGIARSLPGFPITAEQPLGAVPQADWGHAHLPPVKAAEVGHAVQVHQFPQGVQSRPLQGVLGLALHGLQTPEQPEVADIPAFSLAHGESDGFRNHLVLHQNAGEKGQVLPGDGLLQRHGGGGHHHRAAVKGPVLFQQDDGGEVGVGLADAHPGVAQGDLVLEQGAHHGVAQGHLPFPDREAALGQQVPEDVLHLPVGPLYGCSQTLTSLSGGKLVRRSIALRRTDLLPVSILMWLIQMIPGQKGKR